MCSQAQIDSCILLVTHNSSPAQKIDAKSLNSVGLSFNPKYNIGKRNFGNVKLIVIKECSANLWHKLVLLSLLLCHKDNGGGRTVITPFDNVSVVSIGNNRQLGSVTSESTFMSQHTFDEIQARFGDHTYKELLDFTHMSREVEKLLYAEINCKEGTVTTASRYPHQQLRRVFGVQFECNYRIMADSVGWMQLINNFRDGNFSLADMHKLSQFDIAPDVVHDESAHSALCARIAQDFRFCGANVIVLSKTHKSLAMTGNLFYMQ